MAEKKIYICDKCGSYIEEDDVFSINIGPVINILKGQKHLMAGFQKERQICSTCVRTTVDEFKLSRNDSELVKESFASFTLPNGKPI